MRPKSILFPLFFLSLGSSCLVQAQEESKSKNPLVPYVGVIIGGCDISNPVSFLAGIRQQKIKHLSIAYDIHYVNTNYECYCEENVVAKGHFSSITPSVKLSYNSGKKPGTGFIAGVGLGYMFAKDRGTEQTYTLDPVTFKEIYSGEPVEGNWDFNSLAPSVSFGAGFRLARFPVSINYSVYFANTTDGWLPVAGGMGCTIGFRRSQK